MVLTRVCLPAACEHALIFSREKGTKHGGGGGEGAQLADSQPITVDDRPAVIMVNGAETPDSPAAHKVHNHTANSRDHWLVCLPLMVSSLLSKLRGLCQPVASDATCISS